MKAVGKCDDVWKVNSRSWWN